MINRKIDQKEAEDMERMRKRFCIWYHHLLLGASDGLLPSGIMSPFRGKKHIQKQNNVSADPGRKYISAAVVCETGRLVPGS